MISSLRARDMYNNAIHAFDTGNHTDAAKWTGAMTHYIDDLLPYQTTEIDVAFNKGGMLVSKLTDLVAETNSRIVTPNCVPEVHSQASPLVTDSS
jgi:hypothetical protein